MIGIAGRSSCRNQSIGFEPGTWDEVGNHPSWTAKTTIRITPITNSGSAMNESPMIEMARSAVLP